MDIFPLDISNFYLNHTCKMIILVLTSSPTIKTGLDNQHTYIHNPVITITITRIIVVVVVVVVVIIIITTTTTTTTLFTDGNS